VLSQLRFDDHELPQLRCNARADALDTAVNNVTWALCIEAMPQSVDLILYCGRVQAGILCCLGL